jgi:hypothetical protein
VGFYFCTRHSQLTGGPLRRAISANRLTCRCALPILRKPLDEFAVKTLIKFVVNILVVVVGQSRHKVRLTSTIYAGSAETLRGDRHLCPRLSANGRKIETGTDSIGAALVRIRMR